MAIPKGNRRDILISEEINGESVKKIIDRIMDINYSDNQLEEDYGDKYKREPIKLFINSFGGSVYDGLSLVDVIKYSETPVHTIVFGSAMSMGLWIFMSGHKRFIGENSTLMYHEVGYGVWDKLEAHKMKLPEIEKKQSMYDTIITSKTKVTQNQLNDYRTRKADWYISSDEAVELGFCEKYKR